MSNLTLKKDLHPENPVLVKDINTPKERGQTRVLPDGSLLYLEPLSNTECESPYRGHQSGGLLADRAAVPAVRLEDIRPRLVQQASRTKSYSQYSIQSLTSTY